MFYSSAHIATAIPPTREKVCPIARTTKSLVFQTTGHIKPNGRPKCEWKCNSSDKAERAHSPFADHETSVLHFRKVALYRDDTISAGRLLVHLTDRDLGV